MGSMPATPEAKRLEHRARKSPFFFLSLFLLFFFFFSFHEATPKTCWLVTTKATEKPIRVASAASQGACGQSGEPNRMRHENKAQPTVYGMGRASSMCKER